MNKLKMFLSNVLQTISNHALGIWKISFLNSCMRQHDMLANLIPSQTNFDFFVKTGRLVKFSVTTIRKCFITTNDSKWHIPCNLMYCRGNLGPVQTSAQPKREHWYSSRSFIPTSTPKVVMHHRVVVYAVPIRWVCNSNSWDATSDLTVTLTNPN